MVDPLDWMGNHDRPLELFREEETRRWVVVDTSQGTVLASDDSPRGALVEAQRKEAVCLT